MPHQLDAWMYKGGRPNRVAMLLNGLWGRMAASGWAPKQLHSLEVRGRRSGRSIAFPVVVADYEGERYLVAMLGEGANWVANVRAAGGRRHGWHEAVCLEEVEPKIRGPIIKRYLQLAPELAPTSRWIAQLRQRSTSGSPPSTRSSSSDRIRLAQSSSAFHPEQVPAAHARS